MGSMYGGFVPVPLNVTSGRSALAYALAHSEACVLFADAEWQPLAESVARGVDHHIRVLSVAADDPVAGEEPEAGEDALASSEASNDALLIYTSGSTGRPKGVLLTQRSILACGWDAVRARAWLRRPLPVRAPPVPHELRGQASGSVVERWLHRPAAALRPERLLELGGAASLHLIGAGSHRGFPADEPAAPESDLAGKCALRAQLFGRSGRGAAPCLRGEVWNPPARGNGHDGGGRHLPQSRAPQAAQGGVAATRAS